MIQLLEILEIGEHWQNGGTHPAEPLSCSSCQVQEECFKQRDKTPPSSVDWFTSELQTHFV